MRRGQEGHGPPTLLRRPGELTLPVALGIDASLSATGLVELPYNWGLDWSRARRRTFGQKLPRDASLRQIIDRIDDIALSTWEFIRAGERPAFACLENYAFSAGNVALAELSGSIKRLLVKELGIDLRLVGAKSARAIIGKMERQKKGGPKPPTEKEQAHIILTNAGAPLTWTPDELDAFLLVNFGFSSIPGADALILREPDPVRAPKRRGKAA